MRPVTLPHGAQVPSIDIGLWGRGLAQKLRLSLVGDRLGREGATVEHGFAADPPRPGQPRLAKAFKAMRIVRTMVREPRLVSDTFAFAHAYGHRLAIGGMRSFLKPFRPFACAAWTPTEKLRRIRQHFEIVDAFGGILSPTKGPPRTLAILPIEGASHRVTIDEPSIMLDDGLSVISLWRDDRRLFSLCFVLSSEAGLSVARIGGIQGRAETGVLDIYRAMTKDACGLRPRDLLIDVFQTVCRALGVERIFAIANGATYHFDPYFGDHPMCVVRLDYDAIWYDRGGRRSGDDWYEIPVDPGRRISADVPARKRALYRKRYAMLDAIETTLVRAVRDQITAPGLRGRRFLDQWALDHAGLEDAGGDQQRDDRQAEFDRQRDHDARAACDIGLVHVHADHVRDAREHEQRADDRQPSPAFAR